MIRARRFPGAAPSGSIVVRLVESGGKVMGFVRQIEDADEGPATYPTELKPVDDVLRLAGSKRQETPGAALFVELEAGLDWNDAWGTLED